jgi:thioredoxin-dependent peroxiredoxin
MPISAGGYAPNFTLMDESETLRSLSDYRGRPVVLYFYPKDDTPGCTKEACNFRDDYSQYDKAGVEILGVSPDSARSHTRFKEKFDLPFTLLADTERAVSQAYGVWGLKKKMGREYEGIYRTTFLIGPDGRILKVFENVRPADHSAEILAELEGMKKDE